jgi:hypothetical protein
MIFPEYTIVIKGITKPTEFPEGRFMGEEVSKWICDKLATYKTYSCEEDWGWVIDVSNNGYSILIGIYDYLPDVDGQSAWGIRFFDAWSLKMLKFWTNEDVKYRSDIMRDIIHILESDEMISYRKDSID